MRCYRISAGHAPHQRIPKPAENRTLRRARALSKRLSDAEWDVLSQWQPRRKVHPGIRAQTGTQFPDDAASGKRIPESRLGMGCIFRMAPQAKIATRIEPQSGMRFPNGSSSGKSIPESPVRTGRAFRQPLRPPQLKTNALSIPKLGRRKPKRNSRRST